MNIPVEAELPDEVIIDLVTEYHFSGVENRHILARKVADKASEKALKYMIEWLENRKTGTWVSAKSGAGDSLMSKQYIVFYVEVTEYQSLKELKP